MGWLSGYQYRKKVTISGSSGVGENFQIKLKIGSSSGGDFHLEGHCIDFPNDIRFTDDDGTTLLDYWIENPSEDPITVWVKVKDSLDNNVDIYCYYGKSGESSASDGEATFLFFDDFEGTSLDTDKWNTYQSHSGGSYSVSDSKLKLDAYQVISKNYQITDGIIEVKLNVDKDGGAIFGRSSVNSGDAFSNSYALSAWCPSNKIELRKDGTKITEDVGTITTDTDLLFRFTLHGNTQNGKAFFYGNENADCEVNGTETGHSSGYVGLRVNGAGNGDRVCYFDWIRIRKYADPEPSFNSAGSEETFFSSCTDVIGLSDASSRTGPVIGSCTDVFSSVSISSLFLEAPWLPGFTYRKRIVLSGSSGAGTGYQVKLLIGSSSGGDFHLNGHCDDFPNDIRFTKDDGLTLLDYWIEDPSQDPVTVWVKIEDNLDNNVEIYVYYGSSLADSISDGESTFDTFDDFEVTSNPGFSFSFVERTDSDKEAHQAVATDGTYFYTTAGDDNLHLYKWNSEWNLIDSRDCSNDYASDKDQINGIFCKDGKLYVTAFKYYTYSRVLVYNASDLSYETSYDVTYSDPTNANVEGVAFHNGYWWVVYGRSGGVNGVVARYNTSWNYVDEFELTYSCTGGNYQGLMWVTVNGDDYLFVNIHDGQTPTKCDVYKWNGTDFEEYQRVDRPTSYCTQGLYLDPDGVTVWWAEKSYNGTVNDDRVVKSTLNIESSCSSSSKWTVNYGNPNFCSDEQAYASSHSMKLPDSTTYVSISVTASNDISIEMWIYPKPGSDGNLRWLHGNGEYKLNVKIDPDGNVHYKDNEYKDTGIDAALNSWQKLRFYDFDWSSHTFRVEINGNSALCYMEESSSDENVLQIQADNTYQMYIDSFRVRKYTSPEPSFSGTQTEEGPVFTCGDILANSSRNWWAIHGSSFDVFRSSSASSVYKEIFLACLEILNCSDVSSSILSLISRSQDSLGLTDSDISSAILLLNAIDSIDVSDGCTLTFSFTSSCLDVLHAIDSSSYPLPNVVSCLDSLGTQDSISSFLSMLCQSKDNIGGADGETSQLSVERALLDILAFQDTSSYLAGIIASASDVLNVQDLNSIRLTFSCSSIDVVKNTDSGGVSVTFHLSGDDILKGADFVSGNLRVLLDSLSVFESTDQSASSLLGFILRSATDVLDMYDLSTATLQISSSSIDIFRTKDNSSTNITLHLNSADVFKNSDLAILSLQALLSALETLKANDSSTASVFAEILASASDLLTASDYNTVRLEFFGSVIDIVESVDNASSNVTLHLNSSDLLGGMDRVTAKLEALLSAISKFKSSDESRTYEVIYGVPVKIFKAQHKVLVFRAE